ncbi:MAG: M20/M25/M40 family metallo-hydrolase [Nitrospirae bacterium]|nr:M20/M25/M40 family metallo-hydrolase [Nitrospirota bacterium]
MDMDGLLNTQRLLKTFIELVNINSPSFGETEIAAYLVRAMERYGCGVTVQEYDRGVNLIGRKKGNVRGRPPLMLSAHMDTIEPTAGIKIAIDDEMIRSAGDTVLGADDKSAIAQICEALAVLAENDVPHGDIEVVFTSAEEKGLVGARNLDFGILRSQHAIVLDSSGSVGNIVMGAPTHITYEMRITGRAAHAGIEPEKGISAIRAAAGIISSAPDGRIDPETTANIGIISGGTATNVVPREVLIHGEIRGHDPRALEQVSSRIFETARRIASGLDAGLKITERQEYRSFRLEASDPFVLHVISAFKRCGIKPSLVVTGGGSDASIFNESGIRAVNISNGMQKVHTSGEFILRKDLIDGCRALLECITSLDNINPVIPV